MNKSGKGDRMVKTDLKTENNPRSGAKDGEEKPEGGRGGRDRGDRDHGHGDRDRGQRRGGRGGPRGHDDQHQGFGGGQRGMNRGGRDRGDNHRGHFMQDSPSVSLEDAMPPADKKFTGRCRLFVGNLPTDTTEEDFKTMFKEFGEFTEVFLNASRGFGFIRLDTKTNAEKAKVNLDGTQRKGRTLRVRFATHGAALRVKFLAPHVSNELLAQAFSIFGELERVVVIVDDRGKPTGEGIVEFARKPGAQAALKRISEGVFLLGSSPRPILVEPLEQKDEEDGYSEKFIQKTPDFNREREQTPRFAPPGSFEFDFGQKWKDLFHLHEEQKMNLQREYEAGIAKLEIEQAGAMMEHQTQVLRQDLLRRQEELRRLEEMHQMEMQKRMDMRFGTNSRQQEDLRRRQEEERRREEMNVRRQQQEDRRQQELFQQQELAMREIRGERGGAPPMMPPPQPPTGLGVERGAGRHNQKQQQQQQQQGHPGMEEQQQEEAGYGGGQNMQQQPMRQSRFDQPPGFNQGRMNNGNGNMGGQMMGMGRGGNMGPERMERGQRGGGERQMREDFYEAKRPRHY